MAFRESGRLDTHRVAVAVRSDATELDAGQAPVAWGILPQPPMQDLIKQKALGRAVILADEYISHPCKT